MPAAKKKCICQLCTCGRHMCPHRKKEQLVLGTEEKSARSRSQEDNRAQRKQWAVPNDKQDISLKKDKLNTTFVLSESSDFSSALTVQEKGNSKSSTVKNESRSWSSTQIPKTLPIRRPDNLKAEGSADFTTTHQHDFNEKRSESYAFSSVEASSSTIQAESWNKRQVPHTQKIKKADTLTLSDPFNLETAHHSEYSETISKDIAALGESNLHETYQRPRTSLKLSGEFQSDSSYQQAFTLKQADDRVQVQKGITTSHLKPEGEMTFDTTSLDYNAISTHVSGASEIGDGAVALKPKRTRPQSEIKIPSVPISDETTLTSDFKKWNVEKPKRRKPADTLQIGDAEDMASTNTHRNGDSTSRLDGSKIETSMNENWQVSRPVVQKPQNNLKLEGDFHFDTTHDVAYNSRRETSKRTSILEELTERTETDSIVRDDSFAREIAANDSIADSAIKFGHVDELRDTEKHMNTDKKIDISSRENAISQEVISDISHQKQEVISKTTDQDNEIMSDISHQKQEVVSDISHQTQEVISDISHQTQEVISDFSHHIEQEVISDISHSIEQKMSDNNEFISQSEDQDQIQYVSWDDIRPKPIRPHSNLRQEGGMEFSTTNRSEFISRSTERVKGIKPKEATKLFDGDFDATTMNQMMFTSNQGEKVSPIRPVSNLHVEKGNFIDETTSSREFQSWKVEKPSPIVPRSNLTQEGTMDFTTTNHTEFEEKRPEKVYPIRPTTTNKISGDLELITTNRVMHSEFPLERVQKIVPQSTLRMNSGVFDSETMNKLQFQEWEIDRPKPIRPVPNLTQEGSMDFTTMNQMQFEDKMVEKVSQIRPHTLSKIAGDFDGVTTNQIMFTAQSSQRPNMIIPKGNLEVEKGKFATDTTNRSEFQQWQHAKPDPVTPKNNLQQEGNRDFSTTNQVQYGAKPIDRVANARPRTNTKTIGEFDGTTTNQVMFQDSPREKLQAIRPQNNIQLEKGEFNAETTNNKEFQQWEYSKPSLVKPHSSIRQEGIMDFTTTNDREYMEKTSEKVLQIKPLTMTKIEGKFDGTTTNQEMFNTKTIERVKGIRPTTNLQLEKGKIESQTTASREFQQKEVDKPKQIRPTDNLIQEGKMDFTTTNDREFIEKSFERVSPIKPVQTSMLEGKFEGTTTNQAMYSTNNVIERVPGKRPTTNLHLEKGKVESQTTASREFQHKTIDKPKQIRPTDNLIQEGQMDFTTTTDREFMGKTSERVSPIKPATTPRTEGKFEGTTTNQAMFQANDTIDRVMGKRPTTNLHLEKGKVENETTASREFQQKQIDKPKQIRPTDNLIQEGEMDFTTTTDREYMGKTSERVSLIKPAATTRIEGKFEGTTTNQAMFKTNDIIDRVKGKRPTENLHLEKGKIESQTTASRDFYQKEIDKPKQIRPTDNLIQEGKMDFTTTSDREYMGKISERVSPIKPIATTRLEGKFEGTTTNQAMYNTNNVIERVQGKRPTTNLHLEKGKVESQTTASREFQQKAFDKPKQIRPTDNLIQEGKMDFTTTTDREYIGKTSERVSPIKPAATTRTEGKFEGTTTNQAMFKTNDTIDRVKGKRPTENLHLEKGKVESQTTASRDFYQKEIDKPKQIRPTDNIIQEGKMDFTTTTDREYMGKISERVSPIKPIATTRLEGKFEGTTTNQAMYSTNNVIERVQGKRPTTNLHLEKGKVESQTTASREFQQKVIDKPKQIRPTDNLIQEGKMDFTTTTDREYIGKTSERVSPIKPAATKRTEGKFDGTTTNQAMFKTNDTIDRVKGKRPTENLHLEKGKVESQTTASRDFYQKEIDRPKQIRPTDNIIQEGKMDFTTTTDREYMGKTSERVSPIKPVATTMLEGKFEGTTTNQAMYSTNNVIERVQGKRPTTNLHLEKGKVESQTTASREFQQKAVDKPKQIRPTDNLIQEGQMDFTTTTDREFMGKTSKRVSPIKPASSPRTEGKFEGTTTNQAMYSTNNVIERVQGKRPTTNLHLEKGKVESQTTASREFQQKVIDKPKQIRPTDNLIQEGKMDFTTTTDREYIGKTSERVSPIKPAATTRTEGKFDGTTTNQAMFKTNDTIDRVKGKRPTENLHLEKGKVESQTTASRDFYQKEIDKPKQIRPTDNIIQEGKMDFTTTTDREYMGKTSERVSPIKPVATTMLEGKFEGTTTNQAMYSTNNVIERVQGKRPTTNLHLEKGKVESQTTASREFQQKVIDKPKQIRPTDNLIQEGQMDFTTTSDREFMGKTSERVSPIKPASSPRTEGKFEGTTTNQAMYSTNNIIERVQGKRPTTNLHLEKGKVESQTTASREFQQKVIDKPKQIRPTDNLIQEGQMDFTTTSDREFMGKTSERVTPIKPASTPRTEGKFEGTTTNQAMFQTNDTIDRVKGKRPTTNLHLEKGKVESQTTASREFHQKQIDKPKQIRPTDNLIQEGEMDFTTTTDREYMGKTSERVSPIKPAATARLEGKFEGTTTNQAMYNTNNVIERVQGKRPTTNLQLEKGKVESQTTANREFQQWQINRPSQIKPSGNLIQEGDMDFTTSNQTDFAQKQITKVEPIKPHSSSAISGEFDGTTTNQVMFQGRTTEKVHDIRPKDNLKVDSGKFNEETTTSREFGNKMEAKTQKSSQAQEGQFVSEEYQQKNGQKTTAFQLASSLKQEGSMQFDTTNKAEFKERSFERVQQIRPKTTNKITEGEFDSTTTNKAMYQQHSKIDRVKPIRHQDNLHLESGKFNKETTNSRDFRQWVKMETKDSPTKQKVQAAGVRTQTVQSSLKKDTNEIQKTKVEIENLQYEPWKLNEVSSTIRTKNINDNKPTSDNIGITDIGSKSMSEAKVATIDQSNNALTFTNANQQVDRLSIKNAVQTQSLERTSGVSEKMQRKSENFSSTTMDYAGNQATEKVRSIIPSGNITSESEMSFSTTSKSAYTRQTGSRYIQESDQLATSSKSGNAVSTSTPVDQQPQRTSNKNAVLTQSPQRTINIDEKKQQKGLNISTMSSDYAGKQGATRVSAIIPSGNIIANEGEMTFSTTSKTDYVRQNTYSKSSEKREQTQANSTSDVQILKTSENRITSKPTEAQVKGSRSNVSTPNSSPQNATTISRTTRRSKPADNLKIEAVPFDGTSTTRSEYTKWEGRRSSSKKPNESLKQEGKMEFNTTSNDYSLTDAFNAGREAVKAKSKKEQRSSLGQSGTMDFTTSNSSYTGNFGSKSKNLRPRSSIKLGTDETIHESMSSTRSNPETSVREYQNITSTSRAAYIGHTPTRTRAYRPITSQKVGGSFEGQTTSRASFIAQDRVEKSRAVKHANHNILNTDNGFTGGSTYRKDFEAVKCHHCPVLDLQSGNKSYTVSGEKNGHIFYDQQAQE